MRKSEILEELSRRDSFAVLPEVLKNKRIILWARFSDFRGVKEMEKYFPTSKKDELLLMLGNFSSLRTANGKVKRVREEASSHQLRQIFLLPPKRRRMKA